jgi:hypothetical protein
MGVGALTRGDGAGSGKNNKCLIIECGFCSKDFIHVVEQ